VTEYTQSDELEGQRAHWQHVASQAKELPPLPGDSQCAEAAAGTIQVVTAHLAAEQTQQLLEELPQAHYVQPEEALLVALSQVLVQWMNHNVLLLGVSHYQRGDVFDLNTSRTVGCLRADYPLCLTVPATDDLDAMVKGLKEQARQVPLSGLGYGLLRATDEALAIQPPVTFTYHPPLQDCALFRVADVHRADDHAGGQGQIHLSAGMINGRLQLDWYYNTALHREATITRLSHSLITALQEVIRHCRESGAAQFTPSDFPEAQMDQAALDQFLGKIGRQG
jgi:non-ribosomal peptide synthase protein (TIGR01720 family)